MLKRLLFIYFLCLANVIIAQDVVELSNGDKIVGDLKKLDHGVLEIETDYSEENFLIDWESIVKLNTADNYIINLASGERLDGHISIEEGNATLIFEDSTSRTIPFLEIVYLKSVDSGFWDRMSISLDGGYSLTKANNTKQITLRGNAAYLTTKINPDIYFNFVTNSTQDTITTDRNNWGANFTYFFAGRMFATLGSDFLVNDEQQLNLRSTYKIGVGYSLVKNFKMYLNTSAGVAQNEENYSIEGEENQGSQEAFFSANYNAFGLNDISLTSKLDVFPSLSESGRIRVNYSIDLKFDLPRDFYIGAGYSLNYDSNPLVEGASTSDYVFQTALGWSL